MGKKRLSRDQKRKAKLTERARKNPAPSPSLAYAGNKYKKDEFVPIIMSAETGIVQADAITRHTLTDRQVRAALEAMVHALHLGPLPPLDPKAGVVYTAGQESELIVEMIRHNWQHLARSEPDPGIETQIGILRTILNSLETFTTPAPTSRGYLSYVTGFLRRLGVNAQMKRSDGEIEEEPEDPFVEVGEAWVLDNDTHARAAFIRQAGQMILGGQRERVVEVAQTLLAQAASPPVIKELMHLSIAAQNGVRPELPE